MTSLAALNVTPWVSTLVPTRTTSSLRRVLVSVVGGWLPCWMLVVSLVASRARTILPESNPLFGGKSPCWGLCLGLGSVLDASGLIGYNYGANALKR